MRGVGIIADHVDKMRKTNIQTKTKEPTHPPHHEKRRNWVMNCNGSNQNSYCHVCCAHQKSVGSEELGFCSNIENHTSPQLKPSFSVSYKM